MTQPSYTALNEVTHDSRPELCELRGWEESMTLAEGVNKRSFLHHHQPGSRPSL